MGIKISNILLIVGNLSTPGGVSVFWNSMLNAFKKSDEFHFKTIEIGGHGKNILGPLYDQWKIHKELSSNNQTQLAIINPSLLNRSFFRDGLFAKQLSKKGLPFIVFFHGWDLEFEAKVTLKYSNFFLKSFGQAKKIFVLSEEFKEKIVEWGYKGEVVVITTTVDANLVKNFSQEERVQRYRNNTTIKILFLSRIVKEKGVFELIEAFEQINKKIKHIKLNFLQNSLESETLVPNKARLKPSVPSFTRCLLTIAGDGEAFEELKSRVEGKESIELKGYVEGEKKIAILSDADLYILPSYTEGLPISVLEAMLFGLPVITTKVGGLKRFFQESKMGYFIEPKSSKSIEDAILKILKNRTILEDTSHFNYQYTQKYLTNNVVAQNLSKHLKELI